MIGLTNYGSAAMLSLHSQKTSVGIGVLKPQRRKPLQCGIFMRKISVLRYVGLGKALARVAGSLGQYANLIRSGSIIGVMLSGLEPTNGVSQMTNQATQGNTAQKPTNRTSLFSLAKRTPQGPRVICHDLTFDQAASLVSEIPAAIVKFSHMEVMQ